MFDQAGRFLRAGGARETFEGAIARANGWLAWVLESNARGEFLARWGQDFAGLAGSPPAAVQPMGRPASVGEVAMLEAWLGGPLPSSYRRFLKTLGQVVFLHRPRYPTHAASAIRAVTENYRELIDEWFEGYDLEGFGEEWGKGGRSSLGYRSWRDWPNGAGVFRPEEVAHRNFVPIYPGDEDDAHLIALHLADPSGEAPVFRNFPDDGAAFALRGLTFDAWMGSMVDDVIRTATPGAPPIED